MKRRKKKVNFINVLFKKYEFFLIKITAVVVLAGLFIFISSVYSHQKNEKKSTENSCEVWVSPTPIIETKEEPMLTKAPVYTGFCLNVPILMYHHVQPESQAKENGQTALTVDSEVFDSQMAYLVSHGYGTVSGDQLVNALRTHTPLSGKNVVVSFDDGYKDAYNYVFPILKKYGIVGNFMIPTGLIGGADYLSWSQIEEMAHSGNMYFTDHTWSHASLGRATIEKIKYEIETAKNQLEQHTGQTINLFTYPYGSFSSDVINVLTQDGFLGAFSTISGFIQCDSFIMDLHRNRIGNSSLSAYGL
ncbi:MAG: polysaccharide deacetylase family protein [Candidatus Levyibacteriota bacterium]